MKRKFDTSNFEVWVWLSKMDADEPKLAGAGFKSCIHHYNYEKKKINEWNMHKLIIHNKINKMHSENT